MTEKPEPPVVKSIEEFRDAFTNRRTIPYGMFEVAESLVRTGLAEREQAHATEVAGLQRSLEHERTMRKHAEDDSARTKAHNTNLREEQEDLDDGTLVKIKAPTIHRANGDGPPRPWQIHEIETLTYRLRMCGADDHAEIRFKHDHAEATVPYPEMSLFREEPKPKKKIEVWDGPSSGGLRVGTVMRVGAGFLLVILVVVLFQTGVIR